MQYAILRRGQYGWDATPADEDDTPEQVWSAAQATVEDEAVYEVLVVEVHLDGTLSVYDGDFAGEPFA